MNDHLRSFQAAVAVFCLPVLAHGSGVVTEPTEANLRAALAGGGVVTFACDGVITLAGTLVITNDTSFDASGRSVTLSGNDAVRVLEVPPGVTFDLISLTVANGRTNQGAGLFNGGTTKVVSCTFTNNNAIGNPGEGGGIYSSGTLILFGCTLVQNRGHAFGGAVFSGSSMCATNCTFYRNKVDTSGLGMGGAVFTYGRSSDGIVNCTFSDNHARQVGGLFAVGIIIIQNTIFAGNTLQDYGSLFGKSAGGHNISSDNSMFNPAAGNLTNTDAKLGPFGDYGGPTWTMPLLAGSPAIEAGDNTGAPAEDQRGRARSYGTACDIGAFESCPPFSIRGTISGLVPTEEESIAVGSNILTTVDHGNYSLLGVDPGVYSVSPQGTAYLFWPASRSVSVGPDQPNVNFRAYRWNALSLEDIADGTVHLFFAGTNDVTRHLQATTNLIQWQSIQTNTLGQEQYWELWLPAAGQGAQFYRVVSP